MNKFDISMMKVAILWSELSNSKQIKVGCIFSIEDRIISHGFNGTISKTDNNCEDENGRCKPSVIHAEENALIFAAKKGLKVEGCKAFITHYPCSHCMALLIQAGIIEIIYLNDYTSGSKGKLDQNILNQKNIKVYQFPKGII